MMSSESRSHILAWMFAGFVTMKLAYYVIAAGSKGVAWMDKHH
ncbi:hypothetical protein [Bacillus salacetis]|nr:hypothetical protein [Bacillus salacetis]